VLPGRIAGELVPEGEALQAAHLPKEVADLIKVGADPRNCQLHFLLAFLRVRVLACLRRGSMFLS
jgi:hypothetical protein